MELGPGFDSITLATPSGWTDGEIESRPDGSVRFYLSADEVVPDGGIVVFGFFATPIPDPPSDYARIHAWTSHGALSRTTALVRFLYATPDATTPAEIYPTLPYSLRPGATALVGGIYKNGAERTTLRYFTVDVPGGFDLKHHGGRGAPFFTNQLTAFAPPDADALPCNETESRWFFVDAKTLRWCGRRDVAPYESATFLVRVVVADLGSRGTAFDPYQIDYWTATLTFPANGYTAYPVDGPGAFRTAPGVHRFRVLPDDADGVADGYPTLASGGGVLGDNNRFTATLHWPPKKTVPGPPHGGARYALQPSVLGAAQLESAALNSSITPDKRFTRATQDLNLTVDFRAVMKELRKLDSAVTAVRQRLDLYSPASVANRPFLTLEQDAETGLPAPIPHLRSAQLVGTSQHEVVVASEDGYAYALPALANGAPTLWNARASPHAGPTFADLLAGDLDPLLNPGNEVATASTDGHVRLLAGATGVPRWELRFGTRAYALASDPAHDELLPVGVEGRLHVLASTASGNNPAWYALLPATGDSLHTYAFANVTGVASAALVLFQHPSHASKSVGVIFDDGRVIALAPDGTLLWASRTGLSGRILHAVATNLHHGAGNGDELLLATPNGITALYGKNGTVGRWWTPAGAPAVTLLGASAHADVTGGAALDVAVTTTDNRVYLLDLENFPQYPIVWQRLGFVAQPSHNPIGNPTPPSGCVEIVDMGIHLQNNQWCLDLDDSGNLLDAEDVAPRTTRLLRHPAGGPHLVAVGGWNGARGYVAAFLAANGNPHWSPIYATLNEGPEAAAISLHPVPRDDPPTAADVAITTQDGSVFLVQWDGAPAWTAPAAPSEASGLFTYNVEFPRASFPGAYVVVATLSWTQAVKATSFTQAARLLDWAPPTGSPSTATSSSSPSS